MLFRSKLRYMKMATTAIKLCYEHFNFNTRPPISESKEKFAEHNGCFYSKEGRGDCEHFIGLPKESNETTEDVYGKPIGWCWFCWKSKQLELAKISVVLPKKLVCNLKFGHLDISAINGYNSAIDDCKEELKRKFPNIEFKEKE